MKESIIAAVTLLVFYFATTAGNDVVSSFAAGTLVYGVFLIIIGVT